MVMCLVYAVCLKSPKREDLPTSNTAPWKHTSHAEDCQTLQAPPSTEWRTRWSVNVFWKTTIMAKMGAKVTAKVTTHADQITISTTKQSDQTGDAYHHSVPPTEAKTSLPDPGSSPSPRKAIATILTPDEGWVVELTASDGQGPKERHESKDFPLLDPSKPAPAPGFYVASSNSRTVADCMSDCKKAKVTERAPSCEDGEPQRERKRQRAAIKGPQGNHLNVRPNGSRTSTPQQDKDVPSPKDCIAFYEQDYYGTRLNTING